MEYETIKHPNVSDPDENQSLNLLNKLYIGASQDLNFSLANAPSGQNLFMMFGDSTAAIVVTGRSPINQSLVGGNITAGDTVNTSQGGGGTTIGFNSQGIDPGEGGFFTYVTGANPNYTAPLLDENEADIEANTDFNNVLNVKTGSFTISQVAPGGPNDAASIKITAFSTLPEPGVIFVDGLTNDGPNKTIVQVRVFNAVGTQLIDASADGSANGIKVIFSGGTATIEGAKAGYSVEYRTSADHNRLLIENPGNINANLDSTFDIGGFKLLQVSTTATEIGSKVFFEDDGPTIAANLAAVSTLTTDDTEITDVAGPASFAGLFTSAFGKDGFKDTDDNNVADADAITYALGVSAAGGVNSGLVDTLSGDKIYLFLEGGAVVGRVGLDDNGGANAAGAVAFTIGVVTNTGAVTLTQTRSVVHNDPGDPAETGDSAAVLSAANLITLTATITGGDGDTAAATRNIGKAFTFEDDGPTIAVNLEATVPTLTTDDTDITDVAGPTSFAGLFTPDFGKDGPKDANDDDVADFNAITYALGVNAAGGVDSVLVDTLSGDKIYLFLESGVVRGRVGLDDNGGANAAGAVAFTISVGTNTGTVTLTQNRAIVHDDINDHDEANDDGTAANDARPVDDAAIQQTLAAGLIKLTATITDGDDDTATTTRDIGDAFTFLDDGPQVSLELTVSGNSVVLDETHGTRAGDANAASDDVSDQSVVQAVFGNLGTAIGFLSADVVNSANATNAAGADGQKIAYYRFVSEHHRRC